MAEQPLTGTEAEICEAFRWNKRHAGTRFPTRGGMLHNGHNRLMYAKDIVARLVAIHDAQGEPEAVPPDCKHRGVIPHGGQTAGDGAVAVPLKGAYEAGLAKALGVEDMSKREVLAKALEGEIIPPDPIGKGPLARALMVVKWRFGLNEPELLVLSIGKDPFQQDTPRGHMLGRWLKVRLDLFAFGHVIHLRGVHYLLVSVQAIKPNGERYQNTRKDYFWLNERVGKAARWLRYIGFNRIVDERNERAVITRAPRTAPPIPTVYVSTGYAGVALPDPIHVWSAKPHPVLAGFTPEQKFCFAVFGEKSSLSEVLVPFGDRHGADLFIAAGELSELRAWEMARDAVRDGRKLICFCFCDFDPSGMQMPVSISRKLMAQRVLNFPSFRFAVVPVALTLAQVIRLLLPAAMVEKKDKRHKKWQETFAPALIEAGLLKQEDVDAAEADAEGMAIGGAIAQVEIDALVAIHPQELNGMAEAAIDPYLDQTLSERAGGTHAAWMRAAQDILDRGIDRARLDTLSSIQQFPVNRFNRLLKDLERAKGSIDAIEEAMVALAREIALPPLPKLPEADAAYEKADPLVDSDWGYLKMTKVLKERKKYIGEDEVDDAKDEDNDDD